MAHQNKARSWGHRLREENSALKEKIANLRKENAGLRKDLEKAWELMAHVPGGLFLLQKETIAYANEAASRWLGYNLGELAGKSLLEILDAEDAPAILEYIRSRAGIETPDTFRFKNSAGESVYCAVHLKKTRYEGRSALLVNVIEIERKMEEERSILEARKFEALREMAGAFAQELETAAESGPPFP
jgi:PAS domain S-box-containing protein